MRALRLNGIHIIIKTWKQCNRRKQRGKKVRTPLVSKRFLCANGRVSSLEI